MFMIAEPFMAGRVCFVFVLWCVFKISRKMAGVPEDKERASEEASFLFLKEGLWKVYQNQLTHAI